jgi:hypothetical protein
MSGTITYLGWAFGLRIDPESKLLACYLAGIFGQDGVTVLDLAQAAAWCGFLTSAQKILQINRVRVALQGIPGIAFEYRGDDRVMVKLEGWS